MFKDVWKYIKHLITFTGAKRVYLAIDGVAPMAKCSQQRKRRFMAIQDKQEIDLIKKRHGKYQPERLFKALENCSRNSGKQGPERNLTILSV